MVVEGGSGSHWGLFGSPREQRAREKSLVRVKDSYDIRFDTAPTPEIGARQDLMPPSLMLGSNARLGTYAVRHNISWIGPSWDFDFIYP